MLHKFGSASEGLYPYGGLVHINDTLFGATSGGGGFGHGTIFSISLSGTNYRVLHSFGRTTDGSELTASLIGVNGTLYGTTYYGGTHGDGTVFSISTTGTNYRVLHNFGKGTDGRQPAAGLVELNGTLYGTTSLGGAHGDGTVYSVTPNGTENVRHSFGGAFGSGKDGQDPLAGLIAVNEALYGTTTLGGANNHGIVFTLTPAGHERELYGEDVRR